MFGRATWDELPWCIFENFEIPRMKQGQTCGYWLITPNQQSLYIEANII